MLKEAWPSQETSRQTGHNLNEHNGINIVKYLQESQNIWLNTVATTILYTMKTIISRKCDLEMVKKFQAFDLETGMSMSTI